MKALFLKELRELAWLGAPIALIWGLWWAVLPPIRGLLGPQGQTMETLGIGAIVLGMVFGFAPFELERRTEMRSFLVHRGIGPRTGAWIRLAAAAAWTACTLLLGIALVAVLYLSSSLEIPGYVARALRALGWGALVAAPALAVGAFVSLIHERAWARWLSLAWCGFGLAMVGGASSRWERLDGVLGASAYLVFCAVVAVGAAWLAVERFVSGTREGQAQPKGVSIANAMLALAIGLPPFLGLVAEIEFVARGLSWSENESWIRTADGQIVRRSPQSPLPGPPSQWHTFRPGGTIQLTQGEQFLFHPVGGRGIFSRSLLGQGARSWSGPTEWAFGVRSDDPVQSVADGWWRTWIDTDSERIVSRWWPRPGLARFETFRLPDEAMSDPGPHRLRSVRAFSTAGRHVLVTDEHGIPRAVLSGPPPEGRLRDLEFPDSERQPEHLVATRIVLAEGQSAPSPLEADLWIASEGAYVFDGEDFQPVARYEELQLASSSDAMDVRVVVSAYDGLGYEVALFDEASGALLDSRRVAPRTAMERLWATCAGLVSLSKTPIASLGAWSLMPQDHDGSATPAKSLWIDPLVLGGRRPWLLGLHWGVAAALAWSTRRRLGGRAWAWPLAVLALGLSAWAVCLLIEPRRVARVVTEPSRTRPAWVPIVDRAST